jgi:hypothetical protein
MLDVPTSRSETSNASRAPSGDHDGPNCAPRVVGIFRPEVGLPARSTTPIQQHSAPGSQPPFVNAMRPPSGAGAGLEC